MERGAWRRAGYRYEDRYGGCYECGNVGRNGRCFGAGNRFCYGRRHETRYGSRTGSRGDTRTGRGSGCRCSAGTRCCWGSSTGGRCEDRTGGRSGCRCSSRNGCCFRACAGRRNEGRVRGRNSPSRLGNGVAEAIQSAKCKLQNGGSVRRTSSWANPTTKDAGLWTKDLLRHVTFWGRGFSNTGERSSMKKVRSGNDALSDRGRGGQVRSQKLDVRSQKWRRAKDEG